MIKIFSLVLRTKVYDVNVGDVVQVLKDETKAVLLQRSHGGWNDDMKQVLFRLNFNSKQLRKSPLR